MTQVAVMSQPINIQFRHAGTAAANLAELRLDILEDSGEIRCDDGRTLAQISMKMHLLLRRLTVSFGATFLALVKEDELRERLLSASPNSRNTKPAKVTCCMELLVLGPRHKGDQIAEALAQGKLFLQHPVPFATELPYENPQYLKLPGTFLSTGFDLAPLSGDWAQVSEKDEEFSEHSLKGSRHRPVDLQKVLDELPALEGLRAAETDGRIMTKLLR